MYLFFRSALACCQCGLIPGNGVVCQTRASQVAVIPAKARIHPANRWKRAVVRLDSRLRGGDEGLAFISIGGLQAHDHS